MDDIEYALVSAAEDIRRVGSTLTSLLPTIASRDEVLAADLRAIVEVIETAATGLGGLGTSWHYGGN